MRRTPWWAEIPLVVVNLVVVAGFARVFEPGGWFAPLVAFTVFGHLCAIAVRRAGWRAGASTAIAVIGWPLAVGWFLFADTLSWGLPTATTLEVASDALDQARRVYPVVVAPTEALRGFVLVASFGLWMAIWFGDWTAHRVRASAEAVATSGAIFVFCAILGSGQHQIVSAAAFSAAVLVFVAVQRATAIEREQRWLPSSPATARAVLGGAALATAIAVGLGALVGPALPGAGREPAFDWRGGDGGGSRVTVSPMVELKKRLVEQSDRELFEVRATQRSYWRLTSLDRFDGQIWSSSGDFDAADEQLPSNVPPGLAASTITQTVRIQALSAIWAPSAFEATSVRRTTEDLRWDPDSGTLIVASSRPTTDGMSYTIVSRSPAFAPDALRAASGRDPSVVTERYTGLPADFPALAERSAQDVTSGAETRYDQAIALQDWFRTAFTYSLESPAGHSDDALVDFLESGVGYCEQFAGAFAAMARSLGMPARVAVGFTPGVQDPTDPERYRVQGRHAHAWPEVYFPGSGWVAFEPTPGRGIPGAEAHTGVAAAQDDTAGAPVPASSTTTAPTTSGEPATDQSTAPATSEPSRTATTAGGAEPGESSSRAPWWIAALVAAGLAVSLAVRRSRRVRSAPVVGEVEQAWAQVTEHLRRLGALEEEPGDTPLEVAGRSATGLGAAGGELIELADLVTESRWAPDRLGDTQLARVADLRQRLTSVQARPESSSASS
jgi:transglutaminase-like putative cysteine protease